MYLHHVNGCHFILSSVHNALPLISGLTVTLLAALQLAGGPRIPLRYGRTDAVNEEECAPEGRLPGLLTYSILHMQLLSPVFSMNKTAYYNKAAGHKEKYMGQHSKKLTRNCKHGGKCTCCICKSTML